MRVFNLTYDAYFYVLNGQGKGGWENVSHICVYGERLIDSFLFSSDLYNNLSNHQQLTLLSLFMFFLLKIKVYDMAREVIDNKQHENYFS